MFSIKIIDKRVSNEHGTFGISNIEIFLEIFGAQNFPVLDRNARKPMLEYNFGPQSLDKFPEFAAQGLNSTSSGK